MKTPYLLSKKTGVLLLALSFGWSGCSFKKDDGKEAPVFTVQEQKLSVSEALLKGDNASFDKALKSIPYEQINVEMTNGSTLLEIAVKTSNLYAVEQLLARGAKPLTIVKASNETIISLAKKINVAIANILIANVDARKAEAHKLIQERDYRAALKVLRTQLIPFASLLSGPDNFLGMFLKQEKTLNTDTAGVLTALIEGSSLLAGHEDKLVVLSTGHLSVIDVVFAHFQKNSLNASEQAMNALLSQTASQDWGKVLGLIKKYELKASASLSSLQYSYISVLVRESVAGKDVNVQAVGTTLAALKDLATDGVFCLQCVESVLNTPSLNKSKKDLIRELMTQSSEAPAEFLKYFVGHVSPSDFKDIVTAMPSALVKNQGSALDSNWSLEEYQSLKAAGLKMSPEQAVSNLVRLFELRHRDDAQASAALLALSSDLAVGKSALSQEVLETVFTNEFFYVFNSGLKKKDFFNILTIFNGIPVYGLRILAADKSVVHLNPIYLLSYRENIVATSSISVKVRALEVTNSVIGVLTDPNELWFLKYSGDSISTHDMLWLSLIDTKLGRLTLIPQLNNPTIKDIVETWIGSADPSLKDIRPLLEKSNKDFLSSAKSARGKYLLALLRSSAKTSNNLLLTEMIFNMRTNSDLSEESYEQDLAAYLLKIRNPLLLEDAFENLFISYLKKQNPRFGLALTGRSSEYIAFLSGQYTKDPLCNSNHGDKYQNVCATLDAMVNNSRTDGKSGAIAAFDPNYWMNQKSLAQKIFAHDKLTMSALNDVAPLATTNASIKSFFEEHSWLKDIKIYQGEKPQITTEPDYGSAKKPRL
ncbi:hypothetical protein D3C87_410740 [compost metagenome]